MPDPKRMTAFRLMEAGTTLDIHVVDTLVEPSPDGETSFAKVELQLGEVRADVDADGTDAADDDLEDAEDQVERGAFGLIFILAALSFADARPRGYSDKLFIEGDELTVDDFIEGLSFRRGQLHFDADYIRGRCVKTRIDVRADGRVTLETWGRGEGVLRWIDRLQGKKPLALVE